MLPGSDFEYETTLDKIRNQWAKEKDIQFGTNEYIPSRGIIPSIPPDQVAKLLQAILNKLDSLDKYIRTNIHGLNKLKTFQDNTQPTAEELEKLKELFNKTAQRLIGSKNE